MEIICTKRHLITNHHILPADFFYKVISVFPELSMLGTEETS